MKLLTQIRNIIQTSSGRAHYFTLPQAFVHEMELEKGDQVRVTYNPKSKSLTVEKCEECNRCGTDKPHPTPYSCPYES